MPDRSCDKCGASPAMPVVYGYPSPELIEQAGRGEVVLGGCVIECGQPRWLCDRCASAPAEDGFAKPPSGS